MITNQQLEEIERRLTAYPDVNDAELSEILRGAVADLIADLREARRLLADICGDSFRDGRDVQKARAYLQRLEEKR